MVQFNAIDGMSRRLLACQGAALEIQQTSCQIQQTPAGAFQQTRPKPCTSQNTVNSGKYL